MLEDPRLSQGGRLRRGYGSHRGDPRANRDPVRECGPDASLGVPAPRDALGAGGLDPIRRVCNACSIDTRRDPEAQRRPHAERCETAGRRARMLGFVAGSAFSLVLTSLAVVRGLDAVGVPEPSVDLDGITVQLQILEVLGTWSPPVPERRIDFLGDSTAMQFPDGSRGLDHRLGAALDALATEQPRSRVFSFALPGYTQFTQYFISHRIAYTQPDAVVLGFNLASFSEQWRRADRPELAAWLPVRHLAEAFWLPLHWIGLSTDELVLYTTVVHAGGFGK